MNSNERHILMRLHEDALIIEVNRKWLNDHDTLAELQDEILVAMQNIPAVPVILDLRHVELLTSVALFPFIEIRAAAEHEGRRVVLCNVATPVAQVLTISQLIVESRSFAQHFVLTEDLPAAFEWLSKVDMAATSNTRPMGSVAQPV